MNNKPLAERSTAVLSAQGTLANLIADFKVREQQQQMSVVVAEAIVTRSDLIVEAGTGIGKTFAYLVPALLCGKRTIISTATRYLQEQIYSKDLPVVLEALELDCDTTLLKGRANYLCLEKLERLSHQQTLDANLATKIDFIERWSFDSDDGDISSVGTIAENDEVWQMLTSTKDDCLGKNCQHYDACHVFSARQRAVEADVVVVNHALLMADMVLKESGFAELLPDAELVIVDEAHQLEEVAEKNFTESFSGRIFNELLSEISQALAEEQQAIESLDQKIEQCRHALGNLNDLCRTLPERGMVKELKAREDFATLYQAMDEQGGALLTELKPLKNLSDYWENCLQRVQEMLALLDKVLGCDEVAGVAWFQKTKTSFQLHLSPPDVCALLMEKIEQYDANWIYTSATLSVGGDFSHFLSGYNTDKEHLCYSFDSPFDYASQAAIYLPRNLPHPKHESYTRKLIEQTYPLLELSKGRAFLLFTSYRALNEAVQLFRQSNSYSLLVQNEAPKWELLERFQKEDKALLLGTNTFWSGVDVKGSALSCVIVDRLPFTPPTDPLQQARQALARKAGRDFFIEQALPDAVIALRQGIGRLIRSENDRGVVMIGDPRLRTQNYGRVFLKSLPPMKIYREIAPLARYFQ